MEFLKLIFALAILNCDLKAVYSNAKARRTWFSSKGVECATPCTTQGTNYHWCRIVTGNKWDYCSTSPELDYKGMKCENKCGLHGASYDWCSVNNGTWGYCSSKGYDSYFKYFGSTTNKECSSSCGQHDGTKYHWCRLSNSKKWDYCSPNKGQNYVGTECKTPCGKEQNTDYNWCYDNDDKWQYCSPVQPHTEGLIDLDKIPPPFSIDRIAPEFLLETRNKKDRLKFENRPLKFTDAISKGIMRNNVVLITHGFRNTLSESWMEDMKNEILKYNDWLVIIVGWGNGANLIPTKYTQAAANTQVVGNWLSSFVTVIRQKFPNTYIWGIGHSLGSHVMGKAGRVSGEFDRITGLDPAGPSFETAMVNEALKKTDAKKIVDIIHTDGFEPSGFGRIWHPNRPAIGDRDIKVNSEDDNVYHKVDRFNIVNHYGTLKPQGTIDFYPNWGYLQPGTTWEDATNYAGSLSHTRAYQFFTWSIGNPGKFITNRALSQQPSVGHPVLKTVQNNIVVEMGFHYKYVPSNHNLFAISANNKVPWR